MNQAYRENFFSKITKEFRMKIVKYFKLLIILSMYVTTYFIDFVRLRCQTEPSSVDENK